MRTLSIETSCDETAISVVEELGGLSNPKFRVLGNSLYSQTDIHREYGGVFPNLARREHAKNLIPLLLSTLEKSGLYKKSKNKISEDKRTRLNEILIKEPELLKMVLEHLETIEVPEIDFISVTEGPGLAPALWVGVNFAEALRLLWNKPVVPVNHMEGHIWSVLLENNQKLEFPAIAMLVSGGHTEIVYIKDYGDYEVIGKTRDDAVGEAYDKVARLLDLPYPGGPEISKLSKEYRDNGLSPSIKFPMPMANSGDFDFSYSGLKTSVLYKIKEFGELTPELKGEIATAFEEAALGILILKLEKALETFEAKSLIVGGGVIANIYLRKRLEVLKLKFPNLSLHLPTKNLSTDNAVMIAMSGLLDVEKNPFKLQKDGNLELRAKGNLSF